MVDNNDGWIPTKEEYEELCKLTKEERTTEDLWRMIAYEGGVQIHSQD
ncbi:hypothetical protein [Bacillus pacificus]